MAHMVLSEGLEIFVPLEGLVDFASEIKRLEKEIGKLKEDKERRRKRLKDKNFVERADADVVEEERSRLQEIEVKLERLEESLRNFS